MFVIRSGVAACPSHAYTPANANHWICYSMQNLKRENPTDAYTEVLACEICIQINGRERKISFSIHKNSNATL